MADDDMPPMEGDREWREETQRTNELAKKLQPPHDPDAERRSPTPVEPREE
jgi:hypothetical protein